MDIKHIKLSKNARVFLKDFENLESAANETLCRLELFRRLHNANVDGILRNAKEIARLDNVTKSLIKDTNRLRASRFWLTVGIGYLIYKDYNLEKKIDTLETRLNSEQVSKEFEAELEKYDVKD